MGSFAGDNIQREIPFQNREICCCNKRKNIDKSGVKCYNNHKRSKVEI